MRSEFVRKRKAILGLGLVVPRWEILEEPRVDARVASWKRWRSSSSFWREIGDCFCFLRGRIWGAKRKRRKREMKRVSEYTNGDDEGNIILVFKFRFGGFIYRQRNNKKGKERKDLRLLLLHYFYHLIYSIFGFFEISLRFKERK